MLDNAVFTAEDANKTSIKAETLGICTFTAVAPTVVNTIAPVVAKIPVVLQELMVQIDVFADITLSRPAVEITRVKNRLKLTQCRLLQPTGKLFLRGFIRENIEYVSPLDPIRTTVSGPTLSDITDIPFECLVDIITFISPPVFQGFNTSNEFEYFSSTPLPSTDFPTKDALMAGDLSEFNNESTEKFTEPPFCELISSKITEFIEFINRVPVPHGPFEEATFTRIQKKIDIELAFKLLQKQQVCVAATKACHKNS